MNTDVIPWFFGSLFALGSLYMVVSLLFGDFFDLDLDLDWGEGLNLSCSVMAVFGVAFGSMGLAASLGGVPPLGAFIGAAVFGLLIGRLAGAAFNRLQKQEYSAVGSSEALIGKRAHPTIHIPSGQRGEALIESTENLKMTIQEIDGLPLQRGDVAEVVKLEGGVLLVQKRESGHTKA